MLTNAAPTLVPTVDDDIDINAAPTLVPTVDASNAVEHTKSLTSAGNDAARNGVDAKSLTSAGNDAALNGVLKNVKASVIQDKTVAQSPKLSPRLSATTPAFVSEAKDEVITSSPSVVSSPPSVAASTQSSNVNFAQRKRNVRRKRRRSFSQSFIATDFRKQSQSTSCFVIVGCDDNTGKPVLRQMDLKLVHAKFDRARAHAFAERRVRRRNSK